MDIRIRIKYGCTKQEVEKFADRRYLVYVLSKEDDCDAIDEVLALLSKRLGTPPEKFQLKQDNGRDKIFVI